LPDYPKHTKGGFTEQLNIEGKRSGDGFVTHKAKLVSALSRALAERVLLMDLTIGRKGFLGYLKAIGGSNVVKVVPSNGSASGSQTNGHKSLKVVCGTNTSYLDDLAWVGDKTPLTLCDVRVSPSNAIKPNIGALELSEAVSRVMPFTAKEDNRPVLQCVLFRVTEGKLSLVSADGFRLAVVKLDFDGDDCQALISRDDLRGITNALRKAKRVRIGFEQSGDSLDGVNLVIDTDSIRYKWRSVEGSFPDYEKLIPADFNTTLSFDTTEALKAVSSLKALSDGKSYPIDLTIGDGKVIMTSPDDKGQTELPADIHSELVESTDGECRIRLEGQYLADALKTCGGMVELKLVDSTSPMLFTSPDYELVVMPMFAGESKKPEAEVEAETESGAEAEAVTEAEAEAVVEVEANAETDDIVEAIEQAVAEAEVETNTESKPKSKRKRSKVKEPVAVA
jgi:DNA polymerase-3 subunit beta